MNPIWFLRMKRLAQNPPSLQKVKFIAGIILVCAVLFALERVWGWPDWLTPNDLRGLR